MTHHQPRISLIDVPALLLAVVIAAPFALLVIAPFMPGL